MIHVCSNLTFLTLFLIFFFFFLIFLYEISSHTPSQAKGREARWGGGVVGDLVLYASGPSLQTHTHTHTHTHKNTPNRRANLHLAPPTPHKNPPFKIPSLLRSKPPILLRAHQPTQLPPPFLRNLDPRNPPFPLRPLIDRPGFSCSTSFTATIVPETGVLMSEADFTDSTAPIVSPFLIGVVGLEESGGSST